MSGPLLELRDVSVWYDGPPVLDRVSLEVAEGELVLVAGATGVGKSTLLGVLTGAVPRFSGGTLHGEVVVEGSPATGRPPRELVHVVGFVGQDPAAGFVTDTVEEELAYGMEQLGLPGDTMRRRVEETLDLLGIADVRARDLRTLSGGQQQRVAIGSVLAMHPKVLVLDEPTSALDPTAAEEVLATLTRLVHDLGLAVVLAEHRLERVVPFADRMVRLPGAGRLRVGTPAEVLAEAPLVPPLVELGRVAGWEPLPLTVREARRLVGQLPALTPPPPTSPSSGSQPVASAEGLTVVHGATVALREVSLVLRRGEVTALMGRNGSGKSSLLWALQGTGKRYVGRVRVGGNDPAALAPAARRTSVGLVPQTAADLLYLESVAEECAAADEGAGARAGRCRDILDRLAPGLSDEVHPRDLSEGQRLALALAVVLTAAPPVLLLDEPTRGLDYGAKRALAAIIAELARDGHALLLATHDVEFAALVADRVVVLAEGEVVSDGPAREVLAASPAFAPQVTKVLGAPWLRVSEVLAAIAVSPVVEAEGVAP